MQQQIGGDHTSLTMASIYIYIYGHHHHRYHPRNRFFLKGLDQAESAWNVVMASPKKVGLATCRISQHQRRDSTKIHNDLDVGQTRWISPESSVHQKLPSLAVLQNHDQVLSYPHAPYFRCPRLSVQQLIREPTNDKIAHGYVIRKKKGGPNSGGIQLDVMFKKCIQLFYLCTKKLL